MHKLRKWNVFQQKRTELSFCLARHLFAIFQSIFAPLEHKKLVFLLTKKINKLINTRIKKDDFASNS